MNRLMLVLLSAAALALAACGGDDDEGGDGSGAGAGSTAAQETEQESNGGGGGGSDEDAARQSLVDYAKAIADRDPAGACATLSEKAKRELAGVYEGSGGCVGAFKQFAGDLPDAELKKAREVKASQLEVKLQGDKATITGPELDRRVPMVKSGGDWKIASFATG